MNQTIPLFLRDTYLFAIPCSVVEVGSDDKGDYVLVDKTIFYPQGGGQPGDTGFLSLGRQEVRISSARYSSEGIRHYLDAPLPQAFANAPIAMHVLQDTRRVNAAYHTAGHWLSQVIMENIELPLFPVKGHHYPNEAYIEFEGETACIGPDTIDNLRMALAVDRQSNPKVVVQTVEGDSPLLQTALLPRNFTPPVDKPLRFVQIEGYRWVPCGGTHVEALRQIKSVTPIEFRIRKSKVQLRYQCDIWETVVV